MIPYNIQYNIIISTIYIQAGANYLQAGTTIHAGISYIFIYIYMISYTRVHKYCWATLYMHGLLACRASTGGGRGTVG